MPWILLLCLNSNHDYTTCSMQDFPTESSCLSMKQYILSTDNNGILSPDSYNVKSITCVKVSK